ncbi:transcription elongation factor GreA [bacterium (Candidatus Gribaldobacteria) CG23_combo_of_CG06-09_8_20_14_all_37_87_8]|uniref:Transcription elongation factor GreA n=2 Tax=Candidatus Gribaldobacteria TaxID=2798536 RepID=A0A2G9ZF17_9BACT|nr:MAG: transcription elongation factor GreA [bacterium (Candidatus Gribaldobacteria) CG23_combo_of_CG06-09_8_20_14_all_37_87_8]PIR89830.1 MAG: transcription elongation factor GreA [bacterium (Candidatus Gribaldobacteria) CG10_big_fil_rev_8_21_14_0_10_37_21]
MSMLDKSNMQEEKFYLTKEGQRSLQEEYKKLLALRREKLQEEAPSAIHSEELEAEFVAFKENKELLEQRVEDLEYILKNAILIKKPSKGEKDKIGLGSVVRLTSLGKEGDYQIVGTVEANPDSGKISNESPIGRALLGKKPGDEVRVPPNQVYKIIKVNY